MAVKASNDILKTRYFPEQERRLYTRDSECGTRLRQRSQAGGSLLAGMGELALEIHLAAGAVLFGRRSYEILVGYWPTVGDDDPMAAKLNTVPKYVASRKGLTLKWSNSTLLEGDVADAVARLKAEDGEYVLVIGSSDLIQTLLRDDLVDTFRVWTFPVVVGEGKRLFGAARCPRASR